MLRPNSRSCRTASIRSGRAGGLAGELTCAFGGISIKYLFMPEPFGNWLLQEHAIWGMHLQNWMGPFVGFFSLLVLYFWLTNHD